MNKAHLKSLGDDLRALLNLMQLLKYRADAIRTNPLMPSNMKHDLNTVLSAQGRFINTVHNHGVKTNLWAKIRADMTSEMVHDLSLLIDESMNIENLGDIVQMIKSEKRPVE
jgi:hypothetical protein